MKKNISKVMVLIAFAFILMPGVSYACWNDPLGWGWFGGCSPFVTPDQITGANRFPTPEEKSSSNPIAAANTVQPTNSVQPANTVQPTNNTSITYNGNGVGGLIDMANSILGKIFPLIISLTIVWFIFNIFVYVITDNETKKKEAKGYMVMGIVAIFVMVSIWALVGILQSTFGTKNSSAPLNMQDQIPRF